MKSHSLIEEAGVGTSKAAGILDEALAGADDGEIFIESVRSESFLFDDGRLKSASYDSGQGFGLRVVSGRDDRLCPRQRSFRSGPAARSDGRLGRQARTRGHAGRWPHAGEPPPLR